MTDDAGQNESRTLPGGEIVHLVKDPGWKAGLSEAEAAAGRRDFLELVGD